MEVIPDNFFDDQIAYRQAGKSLRRAQRIASEAARDIEERRAAAELMAGDLESYPGFSMAAAQQSIDAVAKHKAVWEEALDARRETLAEADVRSSAHYLAHQAIYHQLALEMNAHYDRAVAPY